MSELTITGTVVAAVPTKGGNWVRLILAGARRINDVVMIPAASGLAKAEPGDIAGPLPVRVQVDTTADGRPTRNVVYWLADAAAGA